MAEPDIHQRLARENGEYQQLLAQHRDFEARLAELQKKPFLNSQEQVESTNLKKYKLRLKDRMAEIVRSTRA